MWIKSIPPDPQSSGPPPEAREVLQRGPGAVRCVCAVCHGRTGYGDGMIVRRGFSRPPSLHSRRLRDETPAGHVLQVITDGFRKMPAQGSRIAPADRWAIAAYIRVLQNSQHFDLDDAPPDIRPIIHQMPDSEEREQAMQQLHAMSDYLTRSW